MKIWNKNSNNKKKHFYSFIKQLHFVTTPQIVVVDCKRIFCLLLFLIFDRSLISTCWRRRKANSNQKKKTISGFCNNNKKWLSSLAQALSLFFSLSLSLFFLSLSFSLFYFPLLYIFLSILLCLFNTVLSPFLSLVLVFIFTNSLHLFFLSVYLYLSLSFYISFMSYISLFLPFFYY